jgi:hypothetical protein
MIPYKKYKISVIKVIKKATSNEGHRMCLYPEKPKGRIHDLRTWFSFVLLIILFTGPFIKAKGNPSLLFNIVEKQIFYLEANFLTARQLFLPWECWYSSLALSFSPPCLDV